MWVADPLPPAGYEGGRSDLNTGRTEHQTWNMSPLLSCLLLALMFDLSPAYNMYKGEYKGDDTVIIALYL